MALVAKLLLGAAGLYGLVVLAVFLLQGRLVFPAGMVPEGAPPPRAERATLVAEGGVRLAGVEIPPSTASAAPPVVLGFAGNAWNADSMATLLASLYPEARIITFNYRGYAGSEGTPSADALVADALSIEADVRRRYPEAPLVLAGFSVGSGIAVKVAAARKVDGLILVTPYDSLARVAGDAFRWLPTKLLFRHEIDAASAIRGTSAPVALIAAADDTLIRPERTARLRAAVPNLVLSDSIAGADHNGIYQMPAFQDAMRRALAEILQAQ